jgi:hypothetical protein
MYNTVVQGASSFLQEMNQQDFLSPSEEKNFTVGENSVVSSNKEENILPSQSQTSSAPNLSIHASKESALSSTSVYSPSPNSTPMTTTTTTTTTPPTLTTSHLPQRNFKKAHWVPRVGTGSDSSDSVHQSSLSNGNPQ